MAKGFIELSRRRRRRSLAQGMILPHHFREHADHADVATLRLDVDDLLVAKDDSADPVTEGGDAPGAERGGLGGDQPGLCPVTQL